MIRIKLKPMPVQPPALTVETESNTSALFLSNVVYRFSYPCHAGLTDIGKSHVIWKQEQGTLKLGFSVKSKIKEVKEHVSECNSCNKKRYE